MHLLDEVEQHDHMADDDPNQTGNTQEGHKPERRAHDVERCQCPHGAIGDGGKHQPRLDGTPELKDQGQVNGRNRDRQDNHEIGESLLLLGVLPANLHAIAGRQRFGKRPEPWPRRPQALRGQCPRGRETFHGDGAKMLQTADTLRFHSRLEHCHPQEGHLLGTLRGIDIQVLEIGELGAFVHPQSRHDRDLLIPLT